MASSRWLAWGRGVAGLALAALVASGCGGVRGADPVGGAGPGAEAIPSAGRGVMTDRYIVRVSEESTRRDVALTHGIVPEIKYQAAFRGFAGRLTTAQVASLRDDPAVLSVEPDQMLALAIPSETLPAATVTQFASERLPAGIDRIDAELNPRTDVSAVGVAVIDTGIWRGHQDLNIQGGFNSTTGDASAWSDDNGHGTHVAGIIGALAGNDVGVRGVAPNARLYAVKVMEKSGAGALSWILSGVDWVAANSRALGIRVANMSLTMSGESLALNDAIQRCVAGGVVFVVAAGNSSADASAVSPANHPSVIAVSAIADSDGACGGTGGSLVGMADDSFATFSNYGAPVAFAAPGVSILSTYMGDVTAPQGRYATLSGTSMAAPHVTGAAAQVIASNPGLTPIQTRQALLANATPQSPVSAATGTPRPRGGFSGDYDTLHEPLVDAAALWWRSAKGL